MTDARAETAHPTDRPTGRPVGCVVAWCRRMAGSSGRALAALWERWDRSGDGLETFTIITTEACEGLADIHHRQPAIIQPDHFSYWLDPASPSEQLLDVARRPCTSPFEKRPISTRVNNAANNDAAILDPVRPTLL